MGIPCIVVAGTHSGCGKTTIACGLMAAFTARNYKVQPFKVGPDFIDPTHHTMICGRPSRNLDPYMMGEDGVRDTFARACKGADIAIIEGVMGMYDGLEGTDTCSTAHVARILGAPVLLVVDAGGMSRSANALVKGYSEFDGRINMAGVIFNRVGSERHRRMIEASLGARALGWIPRSQDLKVSDRHLGLRMAGEDGSMKNAGKAIEEHCDIEGIAELANTSALRVDDVPEERHTERDVTIGVAMDEAFCFYYRDNLDRLARNEAGLDFFSPITDRLPDVDAVYLGGGYPELHAEKLALSGCRDDIRKAADDGMPIYAECGGLMYLTKGISCDKEYPMAGIFPARSVMTKRLQALSYIDARSVCDNGVLERGLAIKGHEFHYSMVECDGDARFSLELSRGKGISNGMDGMYAHNSIGCYTHAYFTDELAKSLVNAGHRYKKS
jgi:cobyrinic acid a,c-diamide synthase